MSLQEPIHANEAEEADWLYDHRDLLSAESLVDAAAGRLLQVDSVSGTYVPVAPSAVPQEDLDQARRLLRESGIWSEGENAQVPAGTEIPEAYLKVAKFGSAPRSAEKESHAEPLRKAS